MAADAFEIVETRPDISVSEMEYKRLLGLPADFEMSGRTRELADWARDWYAAHGRPWTYARRAHSMTCSGDTVDIDGASFTSPGLSKLLAETRAEGAFFAAVSAGKECEEYARLLWHEERPDEYFFLEIFGSAVVEHLIAQAAYQLCAWADGEKLSILPHISPGYTGWDILDQQHLMGTIQKGLGKDLPGDLGVLPTGMLTPKKSLLGVFGVSHEVPIGRSASDRIPCTSCSLAGCAYRRMPYTRPLPIPEPIGRSAAADPSARPSPAYSFAVKVLEKWSNERLTLDIGEDGSVKASFRFSGTTCSNMGRPLEFHYLVSLAPRSEAWKILDARCVPAPEDTGHTSMCEYKNTGGGLLRTIGDERPLLGRPLHDVFGWKRDYSPSGCYCNEAGRHHKWGMAYEVIAYALNKRNSRDQNI